MVKSLQDKQLYKKIKSRDRDAFIEAYDRHLDDIYRFIFFKVNSAAEAEDLSSYTFLKAWDHVQNNNLKDYKTLKALFYKIARNAVIDYYRKNSKAPEQDLESAGLDIIDRGQDPAKRLAIKEEARFLLDKMNELKDEYRDVLVLRYVNEFSVTEIAEVLGKSKGNIRVIIYRATKALKEISKDNN